MQLFYTPLSHFSRKVRILSGLLGLDMLLVDVGNTAEADLPHFGGNPLLRVPVLWDGERMLMESDAIAAYLVRRFDPADAFGVLTQDLDRLNARAVMNGVMAAEVELILAARTGLDVAAHRRFAKHRQVIVDGLHWLERWAFVFDGEPDYLDFHLVCMWEHLLWFRNMPAGDFPQLSLRAERIGALPIVACTWRLPETAEERMS